MLTRSPNGDSAQRRPERQPRRHRCPCRHTRRAQTALNEGRSVNPGDTSPIVGDILVHLRRSTKAGASTPATRRVGGDRDGVRVRSTKAGASTPATRGPRADDRTCSHPRSTKAGASTPATRGRRARRVPRVRPALNEGRSVNPGDTRHSQIVRPSFRCAQRRPERQPRRHPPNLEVPEGN